MRIGPWHSDASVLVVAEIGNNHEGRFEVAQELVRKAAECGVDAVKFQTFQTRYFVRSADRGRYEQLSSFELPYRQVETLCRLAKSLGVLFFSTPLDLESARFLKDLVDGYKIASGDNDFYPLLDYVCSTGKPMIMSSGLSELTQVIKSKEFIDAQWRRAGIAQELVVLHCLSSYPAPLDQLHLSAIPLLIDRLRCPVGYSDHAVGTEACAAAVAIGACMIEKHFTLDKHASTFRDHQLSADPVDMKHLVQQIRCISLMRGRPEKRLQDSERALAESLRRSIVAASNLPKGHRVERTDLTWLRPAGGLSPGNESALVGRRLTRDVSHGEPILLDDVEAPQRAAA